MTQHRERSVAERKWMFDWRAWLRDAELQQCSLASKGLWMQLLCIMQDKDTGELSGTADELAGLAGCESQEFIDCLRELKENGAATIRFDGTQFHVKNRRLARAVERRNQNRDRQQRHRDRQKNDPVVIAFEKFWAAYPKLRRQDKPGALHKFREVVAAGADPEVIIAKAREYARSDQGRGKFVRGPHPWLHQQAWLDDPGAWRDRDKATDKSAPRQITKEEFHKLIEAKQFSFAKRDPDDELYVWGTLVNGQKVECVDYYPKPQNNGEKPPPQTPEQMKKEAEDYRKQDEQ